MSVKDDKTTDIITFGYKFTFSDGAKKEFLIRLDRKNLHLIQAENKPSSPWAALKNFRCPNCPLDISQYEFCPIATNIIELIDYFKNRESIEEIDLLIETQERKYLGHTSLQVGLSSLLGIYMVTAGCPILERLKPMVRYHLPFATLEETTYRAVTMYLLAQYFLRKRGRDPDWDLNNLTAIYNEIQVVNNNLCNKLREIISKDAAVNALIKLDASSFYIPLLYLNKSILDEIEFYFNIYFK